MNDGQEPKNKSPAVKGPKPVQVIREGAVAASIWRRQAPSGFEYFDFTLSRSYKSTSSGKEGYSANFFDTNAAAIVSVVEKAAAWIASRQVKLGCATSAESVAP